MKTQQILMRVSERDKSLIVEMASKAGLSISAFILSRVWGECGETGHGETANPSTERAAVGTVKLDKLKVVNRAPQAIEIFPVSADEPKILNKKPPPGSKWSSLGWRQTIERLGREPAEWEWELYQRGRL